MRKLLTREEAEKIAGKDIIALLDNERCEPTNTVGYNGAMHGDSLTEWSASIHHEDMIVIAYYYTDNEDDQRMADCDGDGNAIDWEIAGYEIL